MMMRVITNYTANAGAGTLVLRRLRVSTAQAPAVSRIGVSEPHRQPTSDLVRHVPLNARSRVDVLPAIPRLSRRIARAIPRGILSWMRHAMIADVPAGRFFGRRGTFFRRRVDESYALPQGARRLVSVLQARALEEVP